MPGTLTAQNETNLSARAILPAKTLGTPNNTKRPVQDISIDPIPPGSKESTPITFASKRITTIEAKFISTLNV